jgi:hypothetical protein
VIASGTLVEIQKQYPELQKSANAAYDGAAAAKSAADIAATALHLDQRAWIGVQRGDFKWKVNDEMAFPSRVINWGKTPAMHVELVATSTVMNTQDTPAFIYTPGTGHPTMHSRVAILFGSERDLLTFNIPVYKKGTRSGEILKLTPQLLTDMQSGTAYVLVHGRVTYEDFFGISHWINFCSIYPEPSQAIPQLTNGQAICIAYNGMDKNK